MLESPEISAPRQDWLAWLDELKEMPRTAAVSTAIARAEKVLRSYREKPGRAKTKGRPDDFD